MGLVDADERQGDVREDVGNLYLHHFRTDEQNVQFLVLDICLDNQFLVEFDSGGISGTFDGTGQVLDVVETETNGGTQHDP